MALAAWIIGAYLAGFVTSPALLAIGYVVRGRLADRRARSLLDKWIQSPAGTEDPR